MYEYEFLFLFLRLLFLGFSQFIDFSLILQLSKRNHLHSLSKRVFKDFTSLSIDFAEWEEEDMTKALCVEVFYFQKIKGSQRR